MGCESEAYLVEDCVPLADLDKTVGSEGTDPVQQVLDGACTNLSEELPTVVHTGTNSKVRKLIIKPKSGKEPVLGSTPVQDDSKPKGCKLRIKLKPPKESGSADVGLGGDDVTGMVRDDHSDGRKKKKEKGENRRRKAEKREVKTQVRKRGRKRTRDDEDAEINEMWEAVTGGNSEDDKDGARTVNGEELCQGELTSYIPLYLQPLYFEQAVTNLLNNEYVSDIDRLRLVMLYALRDEKESPVQLMQLFNKLASQSPKYKLGLVQLLLKQAGVDRRTGDLYWNRDLLNYALNMARGLKGVENVYTQHQPLLTETMESIVKGRLRDVA